MSGFLKKYYLPLANFQTDTERPFAEVAEVRRGSGKEFPRRVVGRARGLNRALAREGFQASQSTHFTDVKYSVLYFTWKWLPERAKMPHICAT